MTQDDFVGIMNYARPSKPRKRMSGGIKATIIAVLAFVAGVAFLLPELCSSRGRAERIKCGSNLRQIGVSIGLYAAEHGGRYPDELADLFAVELSPGNLICPSSVETDASGATTQEVLDDFHKPFHCSYVYLGKGMTTSVAGSSVVAFESVRNHNGAGMEVLYADGHVDWCDAKEPVAIQLMSKLPTSNH